MITVGMDVHVRNSYLHVTHAERRVLRNGRSPNSFLGLAVFFARVERVCKPHREPVHVVLESTTNSRGIWRLLSSYGAQARIDLTAEVMDARKPRIIVESMCKADSVDARRMLEDVFTM